MDPQVIDAPEDFFANKRRMIESSLGSGAATDHYTALDEKLTRACNS